MILLFTQNVCIGHKMKSEDKKYEKQKKIALSRTQVHAVTQNIKETQIYPHELNSMISD